MQESKPGKHQRRSIWGATSQPRTALQAIVMAGVATFGGCLIPTFLLIFLLICLIQLFLVAPWTSEEDASAAWAFLFLLSLAVWLLFFARLSFQYLRSASRAKHGAADLTRDKWIDAHVAAMILMIAFYVWALGWAPIPSAYHRSDKAREFIEDLYPDRLVADRYRSDTAYVAVLYHVIRTGDAHAAVKALDFAAQYRFGYASACAIERLDDESPHVREAAHRFLVSIAGNDYGPAPEAWRAWEHNPAQKLFGLKIVGQRTLIYALPLTVILWGLLFRYLRRRLELTGPSWLLILGSAWFAFAIFVFPGLLPEGYNRTCTFGEETISFVESHGHVFGLESSRRVSEFGRFLLTAAVWILGTVMIGAVVGPLEARGRQPTRRKTDDSAPRQAEPS